MSVLTFSYQNNWWLGVEMALSFNLFIHDLSFFFHFIYYLASLARFLFSVVEVDAYKTTVMAEISRLAYQLVL